MLSKLNITKIMTALNGQEALEIIENEKPEWFDAIFMDCQMVHFFNFF